MLAESTVMLVLYLIQTGLTIILQTGRTDPTGILFYSYHVLHSIIPMLHDVINLCVSRVILSLLSSFFSAFEYINMYNMY